jgi:hypothetical protein
MDFRNWSSEVGPIKSSRNAIPALVSASSRQNLAEFLRTNAETLPTD